MFLHMTMSSRRTMYDWALANLARSRSSARGGSCLFLVRTSQESSYSFDCWQCGQLSVAGLLDSFSSKKSRSSIAYIITTKDTKEHEGIKVGLDPANACPRAQGACYRNPL